MRRVRSFLKRLGRLNKSLAPLDYVLDFFFGVDIVVQAFSGYFNLGGSRFPVLEYRLVLRRYLRTW